MGTSFLTFSYVVAHGFFCRRQSVHGNLIGTLQCCCSLVNINSGWAETGQSSVINIFENLPLSNYREGLLLITVGISSPLPNRCSRAGSLLSSGFLNDRVRYILAFHFERDPRNDTFQANQGKKRTLKKCHATPLLSPLRRYGGAGGFAREFHESLGKNK